MERDKKIMMRISAESPASRRCIKSRFRLLLFANPGRVSDAGCSAGAAGGGGEWRWMGYVED